MAIGDTVQAGLMRVDFSPFLEAGRANAAANASFGNALGTIAKGYFEGQEKKARSEEITGYLMNQGASEKDAKAISKNPFLQKQYQQQKQTEAEMKMEERRLATQANIAAQGIAAKQAQIDQEYKREDEAKALVQQEVDAFNDRLNDFVPTDELTPEAQQRIDSFSSATAPNDPRRLAQVNDPQAFMERVENDPTSYVKKPVYELEGRDFLNQFEDPGMFQKAMAFDQKRQAAQPKAPTPKELADLKAVQLTNQKKEMEIEAKTNPKPTANLAYTDATINAISDAEATLSNSRFPVTGFWGNQLKDISGTGAADLKSSIKTINSAIGFDKLQDMRDRSPTGGALGQVSERELSQLNASLGSLEQSQSTPQFKKNLARVKDHYLKYYKATMAQVKAYDAGLKFENEKEGMSWYDKNFPMGGKPTSDNQTNVITKGGWVLTTPGN